MTLGTVVRGRHVLVVDDDDTQRKLTMLRLAEAGYQITTAADGRTALGLMAQQRPDAVAADVLMPGLDGFELCRVIRADPALADTRVLLVSSVFIEDEDRELARRAGADGFVTREPDHAEVVGALAEALGEPPRSPADPPHYEALRSARLSAALLKENQARQELAEQLVVSQNQTFNLLARAVGMRDVATGGHIERIGALCGRIARERGLDPELCEMIRHASCLHDLGKMALPDAILLKPGPLTPAEREVVQQHAQLGHMILTGSGSELLELAATIALTHHERWDGSGYPRGLRGEAIPVEARIVAVADVFDALTNDRPYRAAIPHDAAIALMRRGRGTLYEPAAFDGLVRVLGA